MELATYEKDDHDDRDDYRDENEPLGRWSLGEINVTFSGTPVKSDYGVSGSPTWIEMEDLKIRSIEILGVEISLNSFRPN